MLCFEIFNLLSVSLINACFNCQSCLDVFMTSVVSPLLLLPNTLIKKGTLKGAENLNLSSNR